MTSRTFLDARDEQEVQLPVLMTPRRKLVVHLLLHFPDDVHPANGRLGIASPEHFLAQVINATKLASVGGTRLRQPQSRCPLVNVGFTCQGLRRLKVPSHVLACLALKAPAFSAGAPLRAASHVGDAGASDAANWLHAFALDRLHAVITLHADTLQEIRDAIREIRRLANAMTPRIDVTRSPLGRFLRRAGNNYVHFGFRDGLSRVGIRKWHLPDDDDVDDDSPLEKISRHEVGEFVLGYPNDMRANPWIRDLRGQVLPDRVRQFFRNGSFGVLRQMCQDTVGFEDYVKGVVGKHGAHFNLDPQLKLDAHDYVKSRLCGRWPDGWRSDADNPAKPAKAPLVDFDYENDAAGLGCPFGAHVRRMNPRGTAIAQRVPRPLMRRGMPYGRACPGVTDGRGRGLLGWFFCASIEEQFEHLLGQWADRVPLGSPDTGDAKDPLMGDNLPHARFVVPRQKAHGGDLVFDGLSSFVTTRGTAYLFYPSLSTVDGIIQNDPWADPEDIPQ